MEITVVPFHPASQDTGENMRNNKIRKIIFSLFSFFVVIKVQRGFPKHQTKYVLLNKRGPRDQLKGCMVHTSGYDSNRILPHDN